ncbi:hypothetical protein VWX96_17120 [Phaeobacter sp. A90a-4f]|uniref:hypothetical protein n=1 Tax=Phaeobacter TaxID=302485 RepID=UPI0021A6F692|nr:hypothetical protein [Phaeobacter inhibens]UWS05647.1 hypothetical protein K4K94_07980 [Phaeobacter inhibens]
MATVVQLASQGALVKMKGNLRPHEQPNRAMYASHEVIEWFKTTLPKAKSDGVIPGALKPSHQVAAKIHAFVVGEDMAGELEPHVMRPEDKAIWVIKTADVRLYGWFTDTCIFVIVCAALKNMLEEEKTLYDEMVQRSAAFREQLDLDHPKYVEGSLEDVCRV